MLLLVNMRRKALRFSALRWLSRKPLRAAQPGSVWLDVEEALRAAIPAPVRKMLEELQPM